MASKEEMARSVVKDITTYSKNKNALSNSVNKFDNKKMKILFDLNNELKNNFESEIKETNKEKEEKQENVINSALTELKYINEKSNYEDNIRNICDLQKKLENEETNKFTNEEIKDFHDKLTEGENMKSIPLYSSFVKSQLYTNLIEKQGKKMEDLQHMFKIEKSQIYSYRQFYTLINEYNFLLKVNLSFSRITGKMKKIKEIINSDDELKKVCERKLNLKSSSKEIYSPSDDFSKMDI